MATAGKSSVSKGFLQMRRITIARKGGTPDCGFDAELRIDGGDAYEVKVTNPFGKKEEDELEHYFEEWQRFPFIDTAIAERAAHSIKDYGAHLFSQIFACESSLNEYATLLGNMNNVIVEIMSDSPDFHALHWEAMWDSDRPRPLSVDCTMVRRMLKQAPPPGPIEEQAPPRGPIEASPVLNLLIVVARPDGEWDVGYRTISRPVVEAVQEGKLRVNVELLRPGTFEALSEKLKAKGPGYYHMVHLDCHGALLSYEQARAALHYEPHCRKPLKRYKGVKAFLMLEGTASAKIDLVKAPELAKLLVNANISICILNACQSGKQVFPHAGPAEDSAATPVPVRETSLGSCLLSKGLQVVVAMAYTVTVSAAQVMIQEFYSQLCAQQPVLESLRLGRLQLHNNRSRRAYHNETIELEDWLLPVFYANPGVDLNLRDFEDDEERKKHSASIGCVHSFKAPRHGFVGRDVDILKIEKALMDHSALLVMGMGGIGKTTLLQYLCEWWQVTRFSTKVFYFGYDEHAWTLQQILMGILRQICDQPVQRKLQAMEDAALAYEVAARLEGKGCVLILDNLESITAKELANMSTLPPDEQAKLHSFLVGLVNANTRVVLGSRGREDWLVDVIRGNVHQLQGLDPESQSVLAQKILQRSVPDDHRVAELKRDDDFHRLLKILGGYPLAMEVVLANLERQTPKQILVGLDGADVHLDIPSNNKDSSILHCVDYSFNALCPETRQLLICLAPFNFVIIWANLQQYIEVLQALEPFGQFNFDKFNEAIQDAIKWGLLSLCDLCGNAGENVVGLKVHPVLPFFLKTKLEGDQHTALCKGFKMLYLTVAEAYEQQMRLVDNKDRVCGLRLCTLEYENLLSALMMCMEDMETTKISTCLMAYFDLTEDYQAGLKLAKLVVETHSKYLPECEVATIEVTSALNDLGRMHDRLKNFQKAKDAYAKALAILKRTDDGTKDNMLDIGRVYHNLGNVASELRDFVAAREYYEQALNITIRCDDQLGQADTYQQIGGVALLSGDFVSARQSYQRALGVFLQFGDRHKQGGVHHNMGVVATKLREYGEARRSYQRALGVFLEFGNRVEQAETHHQIGILAEELGDFVEARQNYQRALDIRIEVDDRPSQAHTYHQIGMVAVKLGDFEEARLNYQRALNIEIELGDRCSQAVTYRQLGVVAAELGDFVEARQYYQRALDIEIEFDDRTSQASTYHKMGMAAAELGDFVDARQYYQRALDIKIELGDRSSQASTYHEMGMLAEKLGDFVVARRNCQSALNIEIELDDRPLQAKMYCRLGVLDEELGDFVEARQNYQRALDLEIKLDDRNSQANIYHKIGILAVKQGDFVEARRHYQRALDIEIEVDDRPGQAKTCYGMGMMAAKLGDFVEARGNYQRALDIGIELDDRPRIARAYHQMGTVDAELGDFVKARQDYQRALDIQVELDDRPCQAETYHQMGIVVAKLGDFVEARQSYRRALDIAIELDDRNAQAKTYHQLGVLATEFGDVVEARENYQRGLHIQIELNDSRGKAISYWALSRLYVVQGLFDIATDNLHKALGLAVEIQDEHMVMKIEEVLELIEARQNLDS